MICANCGWNIREHTQHGEVCYVHAATESRSCDLVATPEVHEKGKA